MLKTAHAFLALLLSVGLLAQAHSPSDFEGDWHAMGEVMGQRMRLTLHLHASADSVLGTLDSPDQRSLGMPLSASHISGATLHLDFSSIGLSMSGSLDGDRFIAQAMQGNMAYDLDFGREALAKPVPDRPQHPTDFPYVREEVTFQNPIGGHMLSGTLTKPEGDGPFLCAVLLTGSGPQDRNETMLGHKPFLVLSDFLTRRGFAVLRFDDRGIGQSEGTFAGTTVQGLSEDAEAALTYAVGRSDVRSAGFIGHSEGGLTAPMVAARRNDVSFVVSLAGPGTTGRKIIEDQTLLILAAQGTAPSDLAKVGAEQKPILDVLVNYTDADERLEQLRKTLSGMLDAASDEELQMLGGREVLMAQRMAEFGDPWYISFVSSNAQAHWQKTTCPVLALNGDKDLQVPWEANLTGIRDACESGGNRDVEVRVFPGLNHLFQPCTTGAPNEYGAISTTYSDEVLEAVAEWLALR